MRRGQKGGADPLHRLFRAFLRPIRRRPGQRGGKYSPWKQPALQRALKDYRLSVLAKLARGLKNKATRRR